MSLNTHLYYALPLTSSRFTEGTSFQMLVASDYVFVCFQGEKTMSDNMTTIKQNSVALEARLKAIKK